MDQQFGALYQLISMAQGSRYPYSVFLPSTVRHMVLAREVMTTDKAMTLVRTMVSIVTRYFSDPVDLAEIAEELLDLIATQNHETPLGARAMPDA